MKKPLKQILLVTLVIASLSIACQVSAGGPTPAVPTVVISGDAAQSAEEILEGAVQSDPDTGLVVVTLTQEQITSYLAAELAKQPDSAFSDPQIILSNGQADVYTTVNQSFVTANLHLVLQVRVDENGELKFDIVSGEVGNMPAPDALLNSVDTLLNQTLTGSIAPQVTGFRVETANITDGLITISGQKQ